jgi:hypothetical protein
MFASPYRQSLACFRWLLHLPSKPGRLQFLLTDTEHKVTLLCIQQQHPPTTVNSPSAPLAISACNHAVIACFSPMNHELYMFFFSAR